MEKLYGELIMCIIIFVDCNRPNKGERNKVSIEWTLKKEYRNKRRTDTTRTKLTDSINSN